MHGWLIQRIVHDRAEVQGLEVYWAVLDDTAVKPQIESAKRVLYGLVAFGITIPACAGGGRKPLHT